MNHRSLLEAVMAALAAAGKDTDALTIDDITPLDHLHGRGVEATRELVERLPIEAGHHLLDIGSGVGGPARWVAHTYGCRVTGIDLTPEFCEVAEDLSARVGFADRVSCRQGDALDLPFADASFDGAFTHNVSMNVPDKGLFFREAFRVVRPGGFFGAAEVAAGPGGEPILPVPWAITVETSHLSTVDESRAVIEAAGFEVLEVVDSSAAANAYNAANRARIAREGPPLLGPFILLGEGFKERMRNSALNVEEGRVIPVEFICRRPT